MNFRKYFAGLAISLFAFTTSAAQIINLGAEYDAFVNAAEGRGLSGVEAAWIQFESRHQGIYDEAVYRKGEPGWEKRVQQRRDQFLSEYRQLTPQMDMLFAKAEDIVRDQETRFRSVFPDLSEATPVVFLPSLLAFNGKVQYLKEYGRPVLLMGVDFIVQRNDNQNVLFSHEFFHAYQEAHLPAGSTGRTMASPLWKEGFATYVSGVLNPNESADVILMQDDLAKVCADSKAVKQMASEFLEVINTDGSKCYADWFMMSGPTEPKRRGYCLGMIVVKTLSEKYPITEMVNWDENRFSQESADVLKILAAQ